MSNNTTVENNEIEQIDELLNTSWVDYTTYTYNNDGNNVSSSTIDNNNINDDLITESGNINNDVNNNIIDFEDDDNDVASSIRDNNNNDILSDEDDYNNIASSIGDNDITNNDGQRNNTVDISYSIVRSGVIAATVNYLYFSRTLEIDSDINRQALINYDLFTFLRNLIISNNGDWSKCESYTFINNIPHKDNQLCFRDSGIILIEFKVYNHNDTKAIIIDKREHDHITFETCLLTISKLYDYNILTNSVYGNGIYYIYDTTNNEELYSNGVYYDFDDLSAKCNFILTYPNILEQINVRFCSYSNIDNMIFDY